MNTVVIGVISVNSVVISVNTVVISVNTVVISVIIVTSVMIDQCDKFHQYCNPCDQCNHIMICEQGSVIGLHEDYY